MPLSPETLSALDEAIKAVVEECGDDPQYGSLVENLNQAGDAIEDISSGEPADEGGKEPPEDDPYSFDHAEKKLKERRAARKKPPADGEADDQRKDNPFA